MTQIDQDHPLPRLYRRARVIHNILFIVRDQFGVLDESVFLKSKRPSIARLRQIAMLLLKEQTNLSYSQIARYFQMHPSTVLLGVRAIRARLKEDAELAQTVDDMRAEIDDWSSTYEVRQDE